MTIKCGRKARTYRISYVQHDLAGDIEITRFSISDTYLSVGRKKKWVWWRVTVWTNMPLQDGDEIRILRINELTIGEKPKKMRDGSVQPILIYSMSACVEKVKGEEGGTAS